VAVQVPGAGQTTGQFVVQGHTGIEQNKVVRNGLQRGRLAVAGAPLLPALRAVPAGAERADRVIDDQHRAMVGLGPCHGAQQPRTVVV
jgi:hypothetical protein